MSTAQAAPEGERTIWLIGSSAAAFEAAAPLLEALRQRFPRIRLTLTPRQEALAPWLAANHPDDKLAPRPLPFGPACRRALLRRNPRLLVLLDGVTAFEAPLLRAAARRQIPVALVASGRAPLAIEPALLPLAESRLALDAAAAAALRAAGLVPAAETPEAAAEALTLLLRRDLKALRSERRPLRRAAERLALGALEQPALARLLAGRIERIESLEALAEALGRPKHLLCLGNGPSSEEARVAEVGHDRLFRVNHLWLERGFLTEPDLVFTGSRETLRRLPRPIFALSACRHEGRLLLTGLARPAKAPFRFVTLERLGILLPRPEWREAVPTNGVYMLATAVALKPERLTVAGIDLFRHQAGSYPGDRVTPNAYTPRHDQDLELSLILEILSRHEGELEIVGEILRDHWEAYRRARPSAAATAG